MIPRRIIQTGPKREVSLLAEASATNLKLLHPDWDYRFFDDGDIRKFVREEFPQFEAVFDAFPRNIQRIDFFRYLAVYRLGGFYFDLDVFLARPLDALLVESSVFTFEELSLNRYLRAKYGMDWEIGNYGFGAAPGDPFMAAVIENCVRAQREPSWVLPMMKGIPCPFRPEFQVLNSTGPGLLTRTLAEAVTGRVTVLFPKDVCDLTSWHQFGDYGVHLMEGSWRSKGGYLFRRAAGLWENWSRRRLHRASRLLGPTRAWRSPEPETQLSAPVPSTSIAL